MPKIIITKGLPGSGKTTWAKQYQKDNPKTVRVNKDELRAMLHDSVFSGGREGLVLQVRDCIVAVALAKGQDVIVDDTNLNPIHETQLKSLADLYGAQIELQLFTSVTVEECIKRDQKRAKYVGEKVIKEQYNRWLKPTPPTITHTSDLPPAVICDIDGTLALCAAGKDHFERDFENDTLNYPVGLVLQNLPNSWKVILVSGRNDKFKQVTLDWLERKGVQFESLHMRADGDVRKDAIVKQELYDTHIKGKYNIHFVLDDRNQVVEFWRSLGLTVFQVAEGDF